MQTSNQAALKLLGKLALVLLLGCLTVAVITLCALGGKPGFEDTYESVVQRKYEKLKNIEGPKIVIIGGSNAAFGINTPLLEQATGYPVANMGMHAGFGKLFMTEVAKDHIGEGDIVILAYEYRVNSDDFEELGDVDLIMTGIDNKLEMYRTIPLKSFPLILGNVLPYLQNKLHKDYAETGIYSSASFDEQGNLILKREKVIMNYDNPEGSVQGWRMSNPEDKQEYLKEFREFVEARGASVYFSAPVLLDKAYAGTSEQLQTYTAELVAATGIPAISNPKDYLFPLEDMFDTEYHCNDNGERKRTELLINDLRTHGIIN